MPVKLICQLPVPILESSGLSYAGQAIFWTHGDSDTRPTLFAFDSSGILIDSIVVAASNIDWESLASDDSGYLYIGDFGNNQNNRTDLSILKLKADTSLDTAFPQFIHFSYPDQKQFPGITSFDCEAMFWYRDSLYLITKNFLIGGNGMAKLYALSDMPGNDQATLLDSLNLGPFLVTGADIDPALHRMVLLCYGKVILFQDFNGKHFFQGVRQDYFLPLSQSEGIAFAQADSLYFSNEAGDFYLFQWPAFTTGLPNDLLHDSPFIIRQEDEELIIDSSVPMPTGISEFTLSNMSGQILFRKRLSNFPVHIAVSPLKGQLLFYRLMTSGNQWSGKLWLY